jgi:hypothetical protein
MPSEKEIPNLWLEAMKDGVATTDGEQISKYSNWAKKGGKAAMSAGGMAVSHFEHGVGALALATGAAAASATGVGLVVTGAAITLATCGLSARSAHKTGKHLEVLEQIYERRSGLACKGLAGDTNRHEHTHIADDVLPYIILQKAEKQARKSIGAVPVLGSAAAGAYSVGRGIYKSIRGTRGKTRSAMATDLTKHFLSHNCALVQFIVSELYSFEEMIWLREQEDTKKVVELLMRKMASN